MVYLCRIQHLDVDNLNMLLNAIFIPKTVFVLWVTYALSIQQIYCLSNIPSSPYIQRRTSFCFSPCSWNPQGIQAVLQSRPVHSLDVFYISGKVLVWRVGAGSRLPGSSFPLTACCLWIVCLTTLCLSANGNDNCTCLIAIKD